MYSASFGHNYFVQSVFYTLRFSPNGYSGAKTDSKQNGLTSSTMDIVQNVLIHVHFCPCFMCRIVKCVVVPGQSLILF